MTFGIHKGIWLSLIILACIISADLVAQLNQSGGNATAVTVTSGTITANQGTNNATPWNQNISQINGVAPTMGNGAVGTGVLRVTIASDSTGQILLAPGVANFGIVRAVPSSCTQSTNYSNSVVGVATGAGTTVTSTTTCVTFAYANNITNSAVTLRLADKQGTPVIWLGGNADFSIPPNSNMSLNIAGVTFSSGITAIAGTAAAINLQINGLQ